jgi:hypothetical protein
MEYTRQGILKAPGTGGGGSMPPVALILNETMREAETEPPVILGAIINQLN